MIDYIKRKLERRKQRRTFDEYGYEVNDFEIDGIGTIQYAQWLHPFDKPKEISTSNVRFYEKLAKKGGMIIDIGAHTGDTTVPMALAVGKEGLVLGLEPNIYVYKILVKNADLNPDLTNIIPLDFAATEDEGTFTFNYSDASFCNGGFLSQIDNQDHRHNYTLDVKGRNLQEYLFKHHAEDLDRLDLVKIDAEGFDKEIIKTIPKILDQFKPHMMVECYKRLTPEERDELYDAVAGHGYRLYHLENFEEFDELKEVKRENMMDQKHFEMLAIHSSRSL